MAASLGHQPSAHPAQQGAANGTANKMRFNWQGSQCDERHVAQISGPPNNGLERTRRVGVPAARAVIRVSPCRSTRCSTYPRGDRLTRRPSESAARPSEKTSPNQVLGPPTLAPGSPSVRSGSVSSTNKAPNSWERSPTTKAGSRKTSGMEHARVVGPNKRTQNNALERTRRVGVPAARAVVRVSPCRSTRCYTERWSPSSTRRQ